MPYSVSLDAPAAAALLRLDRSNRMRVEKKLIQLRRDDLSSRHLRHGLPAFVEDVGQYRVCFFADELLKEKHVVFIGDHKDYEKWFRSAEG